MWFLLLLTLSFAHEPAASKDEGEFEGMAKELSVKYFAGAYLVYDCIEKHFVCTDEMEFKQCETNRQEEEKDMDIGLSCVPIEKFEDRKACEVEQKNLVNQGRYVNFCLHEDFKKRLIR